MGLLVYGEVQGSPNRWGNDLKCPLSPPIACSGADVVGVGSSLKSYLIYEPVHLHPPFYFSKWEEAFAWVHLQSLIVLKDFSCAL